MSVSKVAGSAGDVFPQRVIIAIDIDCFYVACERLRNPDLVGKPIGIQQKHILATCSYEARAHGIHKLQNVKDAMRMYPQLLLVNGEDLTHYRRYSRAITRLVKSIVWDRNVERLGMDELFCDVTAMVRAHLKDRANNVTASLRGYGTEVHDQEEVFFRLTRDSEAERPTGFRYSLSAKPSLVIPQESSSSSGARYSAELLAAAHLAAYIRKRIEEELGFTTSAGIAHNKILGKLVASLNKPALQTTWNPEVHHWHKEQAAFLAGFEIRSLQGFGHSITNVVRKHIAQVLQLDEEASHELPLTVAMTREHCTRQQFVHWFNAKLGNRLYDLLYGYDCEPVNPSPEYPVQISTEDSHIGIQSYKAAVDEMGPLCLHLLQRLQEDLTEAPDGSALTSATGDPRDVRWARYPTLLRLTIRQGYERGRESKSTPFPIDAIDTYTPVEERADKLVRGVLSSLLRKLLRVQGLDAPCYLTIINICATNFTTERPPPTLQSTFMRHKAITRPKDEPVDLTTLASSQDDPLPQAVWLIEDEQDDDGADEDAADITSSEDTEDDVVFVGEKQPGYTTCDECGSRLFSFSAAAHKAFHEAERRKEVTKTSNAAPAQKRIKLK